MRKLAIITTHPIQYNAPLFKELAMSIDLKVFYTWGQSETKVYDPGFGKEREWDIPILEGYHFEFVENISKSPGSHHFNGINNPSLINKIKDFDPDAIFVFGWSFKSHLKVLRYFKGKTKILFRGDSTLLDEAVNFSLKKLLRRIFLRWVYSFVDTALFTGIANRQYFLEHGLKPHQLIFAPHAIDNPRFFPCDLVQQQAADWRNHLGIIERHTVFLFAGKLEQKKTPALLITAFKKLNNADTHLVIAGNGELLNTLIQMSKGQPNIHFVDFQNQSKMPLVYAMADVFVLPSNGPGETWGLAVNEAMASGKAVIVSDHCGCAADLVEDAVNGYIFRAADEKALIEKMQILIDKTATKQMGGQSLKKIAYWNYKVICEAIENII